MYNVFAVVKDRIQGKAKKGQRRSSKWKKVKTKHLKKNNYCACCLGKKNLEVHHVVPFNIAPDLELDSENFITLCENKKYGINCHLLVGHLGNYRRTNPSVNIDAVTWRMKIKG